MSKELYTEIDGQKVKLTNLNKVLFPGSNIIKAQFIQYLTLYSDLILSHVRDRPLTIIRYPDGIAKKGFYAKDKPKWTPNWVQSVEIEHEDSKIDYLVISDKPSLIWLANLAAIEIHTTHFKVSNESQPDHFIFDLDPEDEDFTNLKKTAYLLRDYLLDHDYQPFVKTSGGKGLHIVVPIEPVYEYDQVTKTVKNLAKAFVKKHPDRHTLHLNKSKRQGKILIDIYRNHPSNTTCAAFSLRAKPGAPISWPLQWKDLDQLKGPQEFTLEYAIQNIPKQHPWGDWESKRSTLHDQTKGRQLTDHQTEALQSYMDKRNFTSTSEPMPKTKKSRASEYVIQLHDATNLHYDLRLERDSTLMSWAIPKGLPFESDQKRLAIRTEDHPLEYLDFEGMIPKGEYGGGEMRIMETGKIKWISTSEDSLEFELSDQKNQFLLFKTKNNHWLIQRKSEPAILEDLKPMLAVMGTNPVKNDRKYGYEVKWDGIRVLFYIYEDSVRIMSRNGRDITSQFPELTDADHFDIEEGVFDGEIVVLDEIGRPVFSKVISRMHSKGERTINKLTESTPAVLYLFDVLRMDGNEVMHLPFTQRNRLLHMAVDTNDSIRISQWIEDGESLFSAVEQQGIEGIMAKDLEAPYSADSRSSTWVKYKCRQEVICTIIGFTKGKGDRIALFGSLHVATNDGELWNYHGRVGTGFSMDLLKELLPKLKACGITDKYIDEPIEEESATVWIQPKLQCRVRFASWTPNKTLREPVFVELIDQK